MKKTYRKKRKAFIFIIPAVCIVAIAVVFLVEPKDLNEALISEDTRTIAVSAELVSPAEYQPRLNGLGEVRPVWDTTVRSPVEGRVESLSPHCRSGYIVESGEVLLSLSKIAYELNLANAEAEFAAARMNYTVEHKQSESARNSWEERGETGISNPTDLALRIPQLNVAETQMNAAQAAVVQARQMLEWTDFKAPYKAVVTESMVNPGQSIFIGDPVVTLMAVDEFEVSIPFDAKSWALLPEAPEGSDVLLRDTEGGDSWTGFVHRTDLHVDSETRLRSIHIRIENNQEGETPIMPGLFVRAAIEGRLLAELYQVPESAMTSKGEVWTVDSDGKLQAHEVVPVFYQAGYAYIRLPEAKNRPVLIAVNPNTSYLNGLSVEVRK